MTFDELYGEGALIEYATMVSDLPLVAADETFPTIYFRWDDGADAYGPQTHVILEIESKEVWHFKSMTSAFPGTGFLTTFTRPAQWAIEHGITTIKARSTPEAEAIFRRIGFEDSDEEGTMEVSLTRLAEYWEWKAGRAPRPSWRDN